MGVGILNQRPRSAVLTDQGTKFAPQFAQEGAREVVIVIGNLDESARTEDYAFAVVGVQVVGIATGISEDRQTVDHYPQGIRRLSG